MVVDLLARSCTHSDIDIRFIDVPNFSMTNMLLKDICSFNSD